ncbi:hypothetical protein HQ544_05435 [Candidatus Falkowbacteria bacterium]|nr:hypothetical protein [Candidatus Falkowbacteria bacterium]
MKEFFEKFIDIEKDISKKKGDFELFAVFLREDAADKWDIVASADWLKKDNLKDLKYLANVIKKKLGGDNKRLSRVVVIDRDNPALKALHSAIKTEHKGAEFFNSNFFGLLIKHGFIITSKKRNGVKKVIK